MNNQEKKQIRESLETYCQSKGSLNKGAASLKGVSAATISQILNENWELIKPEMWRNVGSQIGWKSKGWVIVETSAITKMTRLLSDAQAYSNVFAITAEAGTGKTEAMKMYAQNNANAYHLRCEEWFTKKMFLQELLREMGLSPIGTSIGEMMQQIVRTLKSQESPLLMLDEFDKVPDPVMNFFISLFNNLEDYCGIVLSATNYLEIRLRRGLRLNKKGSKEIFSRIGRRFLSLKAATSLDVTAICMANGVSDKQAIKEIIEEAKIDNFDLRRVKRKIHAVKQRLNNN